MITKNEIAESFLLALQEEICTKLEQREPNAKFKTEEWQRDTLPDSDSIHAGGGVTKVLNGDIFEQAGVNFSSVSGELPATMSKVLTGQEEKLKFYATGISLVIHPYSPLVPTTHANYRFLQVADYTWFGGGLDLTPYYYTESDIVQYHQSLKDLCDRYDTGYYPQYKQQCDQYFYLPHRKETRGVGGLFFDYLGKDKKLPVSEINEQYLPFIQELGHSTIDFYLEFVDKYKDQKYTQAQKDFQLIRRGRYVEFNLLFDRGTKFGLETGGRTESILMSLPPNVKWLYDYQPEPDTPEAALIELLENSRDWL